MFLSNFGVPFETKRDYLVFVLRIQPNKKAAPIYSICGTSSQSAKLAFRMPWAAYLDYSCPLYNARFCPTNCLNTPSSISFTKNWTSKSSFVVARPLLLMHFCDRKIIYKFWDSFFKYHGSTYLLSYLVKNSFTRIVCLQKASSQCEIAATSYDQTLTIIFSCGVWLPTRCCNTHLEADISAFTFIKI